MHRRHRKDGNHAEIQKAFESLGCSVQNTSQLGHNFPDLVIAKRGRTGVVEVKFGDYALSEGQVEFCQTWKGKVYVARSLDDVPVIVANLVEGI